jgi:ubiquinone/menaquinone biosynthesis C-methylase UbiE
MKKLNFGCGNDVRKGWDNCDVQEGKGVISFNFNSFPYPIKESTYDYIEARQVLNFLKEPDEVLYELRRITKQGGIIWVKVPWYNNKGAHNDIQTKYYFNDDSFIHFATQFPCRINTEKKFEIIKIEKQPTIIGKFMPAWLRGKLDVFISGMISNIIVEFKVIKESKIEGKTENLEEGK